MKSTLATPFDNVIMTNLTYTNTCYEIILVPLGHTYLDSLLRSFISKRVIGPSLLIWRDITSTNLSLLVQDTY